MNIIIINGLIKKGIAYNKYVDMINVKILLWTFISG
jgi:hypothetical protein